MTVAPVAAGCTITWWGHAAAEIALDGARFVTDPLLRRHIGPLHSAGHRPPRDDLAGVDAVLLSHLHRDHTDLPSLARFGASTRVFLPVGAGPLVSRRVHGAVAELRVDESATVGPVTVRALFADHGGRRHRGGPDAGALGYLLTGTRTVYFAGDTDLFLGMRSITGGPVDRRLDVALLPVSGWGLTLGPGHLDPVRAAQALSMLRARIAIPVHWGTLRVPLLWRTRPGRYVTPAAEFAARAATAAPGCRVVVPAPGERVDVPELVGRDA